MTKRGNKLIAIFVAVIMSAAFLLTCFSIFSVFLKKEDAKAADLTISTFAQLESFMNNSDTYSGKIVVLANNIDCGGASIGKTNFAGTFDGQGYTISNIVTTGAYNNVVTGKQGVKHGYFAIGFFGVLKSTAIVQNLRLSNVSSIQNSELSACLDFAISFGGIAGSTETGSKIEFCIVDTYYTECTNIYSGVPHSSGIFGVGEASVVNCYVEGITAKGPNVGCNVSGIGPGRSFAQKQNTTGLSSNNPVMQNCVVKDGYKYDNPIAAVGTIQNYYTSNIGDGFKNLGSNLTIGGTYDEIYNHWYYNPNYNNGWPYLRTFIKQWNSYKFNFDIEKCDVYFTPVGESSSQSVNGETLYYPGSGVGAFYGGITEELKLIGGNSLAETTYITYINNNPMYLALGTFIVECKTGYNFDYFYSGAMSSKNHTIYVDTYKDEYNFEFKAPTINGQALNSSQYTIDITNLSYIEEGSMLEVSYSHIGNSLYIKYIFESNFVTYTITVGEYTIDSYGLGNNYIEESAVVPDYGANGTTVSVTPTLKLKQYNITFG